MKSELAKAGIPKEITERALLLDAIVQTWRRRVSKRELGRMALRELNVPLDIPKLDVMIAIWAPSNEFDKDDDSETMVSTIASRLGIDPSRASRLVSDLIGQGFVQRALSDQDARRTVVELTDKGLAVVNAVREIKFLILGEYLNGWSIEDIDTFLPLLDRFAVWADSAESTNTGPLHAEIERLATRLQKIL